MDKFTKNVQNENETLLMEEGVGGKVGVEDLSRGFAQMMFLAIFIIS